MSSKLDQLVDLVDTLHARSTNLVNSIQESNYLITDIVDLNNNISNADTTIDEMGDMVSNNYTYLNEFENLYEKSFLLESSMHLNDRVTSETTLDNLYQEYRFLMNRFMTRKEYGDDEDDILTAGAEESTVSTHFQTPPRLHNAISVSNLKLKPIRCRSKRIPRKKSSVRMLSTSTVKTLNASDKLPSIPDASEICSFNSNIGKRPSIHDLSSSPVPKKIALSHNDTTDTTITQTSRLMDNQKAELNDDSNTISTSPDLFSELHSRIKIRSNSLPETPKIEKFELNNFNILKHHDKIESSNGFLPFESNTDSDELIRLNRLKHFISYGHNLNVAHSNEQDISPKSPHSKLDGSIFNKTPCFTQIDLENQCDIDKVSVCSGFSSYSSEELNEELDNFEDYLRKSRVNLTESFPNLITKVRSHDSIFTTDDSISLPASVPEKHFKFHNPIDSMNLNSMKIATTTIDPIYYQGNEKSSYVSAEATKLKGNTTKFLNDVISKTDQKETLNNRTPNKIRKTLFNYLNSPSKSSHSSSPTKSSTRRGSLDMVSKSLSEGFMSLVNSTSMDKFKKHESPSKPSHNNVRIGGRKNMGIHAKEKPISIQNETLAKRLPPRRKDGAHSNLIIGPNKTKILNHGDQSVFRKPIMTKISRNSLNEALCQSIL